MVGELPMGSEQPLFSLCTLLVMHPWKLIVTSHWREIQIIIKRVLLAVAQSRSLHVVHEAYLCKSCFRNAIYPHF